MTLALMLVDDLIVQVTRIAKDQRIDGRVPPPSEPVASGSLTVCTRSAQSSPAEVALRDDVAMLPTR